VSVDAGERHLSPPVRRGGRDERREATLRALTAGIGAQCAYCGRVLPELSPRGGRPTPYCAPDPERYGNWGAKVITCAMLDEQREIWVHLYGPQPITPLDLAALDGTLATALSALDPLRTVVGELSTRVTGEAADALAAKASAEEQGQQARAEATQAIAERDQALAEASAARQEAADAIAAREDAARQASEALQARDQALVDQRAAEQIRDDAVRTKQAALDKVTQSQDRVADLQQVLERERQESAAQREQLRAAHVQALQELQTSLAHRQDERLQAQAAEFRQQTQSAATAAEARIDAVTSQLTAASQSYAQSLAPLHQQLSDLRRDLDAATAATRSEQRRLTDLRAALTRALEQQTDEPTLRQALSELLGADQET
jgi:DNA repair exonuclease SbcCD ATPase subunit